MRLARIGMRSSFIVGIGLIGVLVAGCAQTITGQGGLALGDAGIDPSAAGLATGPAGANGEHPGEHASAQKSAELPKCAKPMARVALVEDQSNGITVRDLTSPLPVLKLMISQSGCFQVVDRGPAMNALLAEQKIAGRANVKMVAADYLLTPQILFEDSNTNQVGGSVANVLATAGGSTRFPNIFGSLVSNMTMSTVKAQSVLFLTSTKTGEQVSAAQGSATSSEIGFTPSYNGGVFGAAGASLGAYATTDKGRTAAAALVDAYRNLIQRLAAK